MPTSQQRSAYEKGLARAHRALYWAQKRAEELGDDGAVEDLTALLSHLSTMMQDSIADKRRPRRQAQLSLD
jgi:hypothetical protein